ncbi:hypothetical protein [Streptomyces murinus]|uniref:hypothetical protein n=1 Tax=Streptomyces murinus TaxID=33900 RepID=UPI003F45EEC8
MTRELLVVADSAPVSGNGGAKVAKAAENDLAVWEAGFVCVRYCLADGTRDHANAAQSPGRETDRGFDMLYDRFADRAVR